MSAPKGSVCAVVAILALVMAASVGNAEWGVPAPFEGPATIFGVGDIVQCATPAGADLTGRLMERLLNETPNSRGVTFGDNSNDDGTEENYRCLDQSSWGRLMPRLFPTPGNHDYVADRVLPYYFLYFPNAGAPGRGYYAYDFGAWRIYALNSELMRNDETTQRERLEELAWLESDLQAHANSRCTMAYFHRPPFSSGKFASPAWVMPLFLKLYRHGVDLLATGHEHFFAALPPLTPDGIVDKSYGVPVLIAGTGGAVFFERPKTLRYGAHGEVVISETLGLLKMTLQPGAYEWAFVPVDPAAARASGGGRCHDNPPGVQG
jgi:calcineurin-like phosphoesterase family protein